MKILYEDKNIIVVNKPAGMAVQTADIAEEDTVSFLKNYLCREHGIKDPYLGVIHRLDQPVSGIIVFALNKKAAAQLSRQINTGAFIKKYRAMVEGIIDTKGETLVLTDHLVKERNNTARIADKSSPEAKRAELKYRTVGVKEADNVSMLDIELITGRFHQIRAQMAGMGHPIVNDVKYGAKRRNDIKDGEITRGIELCAYYLCFRHPVTGRLMEFSTGQTG